MVPTGAREDSASSSKSNLIPIPPKVNLAAGLGDVKPALCKISRGGFPFQVETIEDGLNDKLGTL